MTSANFFSVFGVEPVHGRCSFLPTNKPVTRQLWF
jgi:hypothetical protein